MITKLYATCGNCGHQFGKYGTGSVHEIPCPQCKAELRIETNDRQVKVTVLRTKQERNAPAYQPT